MEAWREELYHHGIKGQKWGVRRYQNDDGTFTEAGKERYFGSKKEIKREARKEFRNKKNEIYNKKHEELNNHTKKLEKIDKTADKRTALGTKKAKIMADYENEQKMNELDQKRLDAKREYREKIGKKRVDTIFMRITQNGIDTIRNQSYKDFEKEWLADEERRIREEAVNEYLRRQNDYDW